MNDALSQFVKERGFDCVMTTNTVKGKARHYADNYHIGITIYEDTKEFEFRWSIPKSIFTIECPTCSPYDNTEHFDKMYHKFKECVKSYITWVV